MRVICLIVLLSLASCATSTPSTELEGSAFSTDELVQGQNKSDGVMKDWNEAGALVVTIEVVDTIGEQSTRVAYTYQLFVEVSGDLYRPNHLQISGLIPRRKGNATSGTPEDSSVDIGDYIADGYFLTQWLPLEYLTDSSGNFVKYYSPFGAERVQQFRMAERKSRLPRTYPSFFRNGSKETELVFESVADSNLFFQPRTRESQSYNLTFGAVPAGVTVACRTLVDSGTELRLRGSQPVSGSSSIGSNSSCEVDLVYNYDSLGNVPSRIESHETYTSSKTGRFLANRVVSAKITKRNF